MATLTAPADTITDPSATTQTPLSPGWTLAAIAQPGLAAIRKLWLPFLLIQSCGLAVVIAYFKLESFRRFCEHAADLKRAGGLAFAAMAMAIASGVVPEIFKFLTGADRTLTVARWRTLCFNFVLFAFSGIYVDVFYRELAVVFGGNNSPLTVAAKVATDQFIYTPIVGVVWIALSYTFREHRYRPLATIRSLGVAWYMSRVTPLLFPCWAYWIPMTCLMYSLPPQLTFVFGALGSAAAATVLVAVAERKVVRAQVAV